MDYDEEITQEFLVESYEMLDTLDESFVELEEDPENIEVIGAIFRVMHTIKGSSGFLGFEVLETLCHRGENLLSRLRERELTLTTDMTNALLSTVDRIRTILEQVESAGTDAGVVVDDLVGVLEALAAGDQAPTADPSPESPAAGVEPSVDTIGSDDAAITGLELFEGVADQPPAAEGTSAAGEPAATEPPSTEDGRPAPAAAADTAEPTASPDGAAGEDEPTGKPSEQKAQPSRIGDVLVRHHGVDRTDVEIAAAEQALGDSRKLGEILLSRGEVDPSTLEKAAKEVKGGRSASESTIRVDIDLLDDLMNLIGELVLTRNEIVQYISDASPRGLAQSTQRLDLLTSELQDKVMTTRMQSIGSLWNKLPRVVRDLAHQCGKEVRLEMEGKETELDKSLIESIKDPLTHIVRNTVDHGIESPELRAERGKPTEGVLKLSANHQDGQVVITIDDDGGGIDVARVRDKAVERELITAEQAAAMSEADAVGLIFLPGFSTAEKVTNVSGRGVGMDVVRTNIEKIGGSVDVTTRAGEGTTFKIEIPLTLAIVPALVVVSGDRRYAIPQRSLVELISVDNTPIGHSIEFVHEAPVIRLRHRLLPVVDLRQVLEDEPRPNLVGDMVVLSSDGGEFGLLVDEIVETQEIVVKPLGQVINDADVFSGATILGDGRVALILDVVGLGHQAQVGHNRTNSMIESSSAETRAATAGDAMSLLLVRVGGDRQVAMSLHDVERLDEFNAGQVEWIGHRQVVQYRSEVMPLVDLGSELGYGSYLGSAEGEALSVVVYRHGGRDVGLMIDEMIDIVDQSEAARTATGNLIIHGRVTELVDPQRLPSLGALEHELTPHEVMP